MTWTISSQMTEELEKAEVIPVLTATLHLPALSWLTVINFAAGAGGEVTAFANTSQTLLEGVDFTASGSNQATAQAIAEAWNSSSTRMIASQVRAVWRGGDVVAFVALSPGYTSMTLTSTVSSAWDEVLPPNATTFAFCTQSGVHHTSLGAFVPVLSGLSGLEWELNPVTREIAVPRADLTFSGGQEIRELFNYYSMRRIAVDLSLGAYVDPDTTILAADFVELPTMYVEDWIPGAGKIVAKLVDGAGDVWRDREVTGAWVGWHPLQAALDILSKAGAIDGVHFDSTTLDYETADPTRSHFVFSRYNDQVFGFDNPITEGRKAGELMTEIFALMSGTWRPQQSGPYEFVAFDYSAVPLTSWAAAAVTGHDVDEVDQPSSLGMQINKATVSFGRSRSEGKTRQYEDTDAVSYFETEAQLSDFQHRTDWLNSIAELNTELSVITQFVHDGGPAGPTGATADRIIQSDTSQYPVRYASRQGFSGTQRLSNGTLAPGMSLGAAAGRYAVHRIVAETVEQREDNVDKQEMILISGWAIFDNVLDDPNVQAAPSGRAIFNQNSMAAGVAIDDPATVLPNGSTIGEFFGADARGIWPANPYSGRGLQDDSLDAVPDWWAGRVAFLVGGVLQTQLFPLGIEDITIAFYMAREIVRRFKNGASKTKVRTNLSQLQYDLGEFVTLNGDDMVLSYLRGDGADTNLVWEICGKKIDIFSDSPGIEWTLVAVRDVAFAEQVITPATAPPTILHLGVTVTVTTDLVYTVDGSNNRDGNVITADGDNVTVG